MRALLAGLLVGLSACASWRGAGGDVEPARIHGLDRSRVFVSVPTSGLTFEASIAPHLALVQNLPEKADDVIRRRENPTIWAYALTATPLVRLRMYNEPSNPVRTPSYMPKGTLQIFRMRNLSGAERLSERNRGPIEMIALSTTIGHHSNGQDGCLFADEIRVPNGECISALPAQSGPRPINKRDGSFSTNYLRVGLDYERLRLANNTSRFQWTVGGFLEVHPEGFLRAGAIEEPLRELYGPVRGEVHGELAWRDRGICATTRARTSTLYIHDTPPQVSDFAVAVEAECVFHRTGWGLFARLYHGQDYYNLGFLEDISRLQVGFAWNQEKWMEFGPTREPR